MTTHWSVVLAAQGSDSIPAGTALANLCESYWYPLYAFIRRRGHDPHDAQDLTQAFFEKLLEKNYLTSVAREKGKFRTFLLASLKHFLANEWDRSQAAKRGGGHLPISLDDTQSEARYQLEPAEHLSADKLYERRWALTLLDQVLERLKSEMADSGKETQFEALKPCLTQGKGEQSFAAIGKQLGVSEGTARVAAHRLRQRYRDLLRDEIAQTVADQSDVDEEIRYLISVLGDTSAKE
ncbi:MAG: sigma-70 family RNA polymerase sigma factor [Verrucomicrobiota bacterium]